MSPSVPKGRFVCTTSCYLVFFHPILAARPAPFQRTNQSAEPHIKSPVGCPSEPSDRRPPGGPAAPQSSRVGELSPASHSGPVKRPAAIAVLVLLLRERPYESRGHRPEATDRDTEATDRDTEGTDRDTEATDRDTEATDRDTEATDRDTEATDRDTEATDRVGSGRKANGKWGRGAGAGDERAQEKTRWIQMLRK
ncbi:hypothetical protein EYF80_056523 [Liparis tanakae]|uniref:Uncharacterized protein n=1 Tax=Liparis tanakae TaxID=230148 RepID=A0A4Z2EXM0_9TELE|nr:hypothetical protein EYF80_056523 [Liparis tanakae]